MRCPSSHVERSRAGTRRGCPVGTTRDSVRCEVLFEETEPPPRRKPPPALEASSSTVCSHSARTTTERAAGSPTETITNRPLFTTSVARTLATQRPSRPAPSPRARRPRAARRLDSLGCKAASSQRIFTSTSLYGATRARRCSEAGSGSHGAEVVSNGATRAARTGRWRPSAHRRGQPRRSARQCPDRGSPRARGAVLPRSRSPRGASAPASYACRCAIARARSVAMSSTKTSTGVWAPAWPRNGKR